MSPADKILQKALVASGNLKLGDKETLVDTEGWSKVQAGLRDRAFWSSQVTEAKILYAMRQNVAELVKGGKSPSEVRRDLRAYLDSIGYDPDKDLKPGEKSRRGTIKDLYTKARLDVMMKTNADQAKGYASHIRATTAGAILAFPAYEFVRVEKRKMQRDWGARWKAAADKVGWEGVAKSGGMIALKTSPIWVALSRFGNPFPPFDFNSGMGVRDVKKSKCREIGLLGPDEQPKVPEKPDFNGNLFEKVPFDGNTKEYKRLQDTFGDQITHKDGAIKWRGNIIRDAFESGEDFEIRLGKPTQALKRQLSEDDLKLLKDKSFTLKGDWLDNPRAGGGTHRDHFEPKENDPRNIPLTAGDLDLIPTLWRSPDRVAKGGYKGSFTCEVDTIDGGILRMVVDVTKTPKIKTLYKRKSGLGSGGLA